MPLDISFKALGFGLVAILGLGGVVLLLIGTTTGNLSATGFGLFLVVVAVAMWFLSFLERGDHL